ncbi:PTS lactose/cellobiose transporter subunit IIA [Erysipelothrix sp. HDW6C]|uniref:PTS lactose/cellobiose transporter subunit IIA n=1 Tax=Erysipelothrix sp. HDW6C TaxID=2714930 RepID=UPI0014078212|nr:PTS lactose/cellobiose transporter subunit IIA [Erysipelothrix sp. HDW6C]QIK69071.1 PTS lactose/cellobiose transporter subunit IIA [Erysipelothrix sp. HDW6C]
MENDTLTKVSMDIILNAGDARLCSTEAQKALAAFDFELASSKMKEAFDKIRVAHQLQTEVIQDETRGETYNPSLLFTHAQDTLMTIYSELNITKRLIDMMRAIDARLKKVEDQS